MTDTVDEIILDLNDAKWPAIEKRIREFGMEQYRLGYLDGEASVVSEESEATCPPERHSDAECPVLIDGTCV